MRSSNAHRSAARAAGRKLVPMLLAALWLALLAGLLGRYAWPLDLLAHFRVQYAALLLLGALLALLVQRQGWAALAAAGALLSAAPLADYWSWPSPPAHAAAASLRLVTFNVWFRNRALAQLARYLQSADADVIVLQEISTARAMQLHRQLPSYPYSYLEPGSRGAVVYSKWPITSARTLALGTPAAEVALDWRGTAVTVLGLHLDWPIGAANSRARNRQLEAVAAFATAARGPLVIAGDLNVSPWSAHFRALLERGGLRDCAAGQGLAPSWPAQLPLLGIRIDHCLSSHHWRTARVRIGPRLGSDHLPVMAELALE